MNMQDLAGRVQAGHIDALHLVSLEGGIYVLEAQMGGRAYPVEDDLGQPVSLRSVEHARQVLRGLDRVPVELVCADVDDEMCGLLAESGSFIGGLPLSIRQGCAGATWSRRSSVAALRPSRPSSRWAA